MTRKVKIMENEKHPLDDLKNDVPDMDTVELPHGRRRLLSSGQIKICRIRNDFHRKPHLHKNIFIGRYCPLPESYA